MKKYLVLFCFMLCALLVNVNIQPVSASEVVFNDKTVYYNGTEQGIYVEGLDSSVEVTYESNVGVEPNTYNATATFVLNGATQVLTATLTIKPAVIDNITLPSKTFVYDGTPKSLSVNTLTLPYGETASVAYTGNDKVLASDDAYIVQAEVSHPFYTTLYLNSEMYINKADYDLSGIAFDNKTYEYSGEVHNLTFMGDLPTGLSAEFVNNSKTNAGEYIVELKFTNSNENYNTPNSLFATLNITQKCLTIDFDELTFNRTHQRITYTLNGVLDGEDALVGLSQDTVFNAGNYTITASALNTNYSLNGQFLVVVKKATVSEDSISKPQLIATYFEGIKLKDIRLSTGFSWVNGEQDISCADKSFDAVYNLDPTNYNDLFLTLSVDIKKASINAVFPSVSSVTYGEQLRDVSFNAYHKLGEFKWKNEMLYPIVNNSGYVMELIPFDTVNYNLEQKVISLVVEPKVLALEFDNYDRVVYNGLQQKNVTATISGVFDVDAGAVQVRLSYSGDAINAGTYVVTASVNNPNYTIPNKSVNFVIEKAPQVLEDVNYTVSGDKITFDRSFMIGAKGVLSEGVELSGLAENKSYTVTVYLKGNDNYFDSNTVSIYFKTSYLVSSVNQTISTIGDVDISKYEIIASAINMYNTLNSDDKKLADYTTLSQKLADYNSLCQSINADLSLNTDKSKNVWRNVLISVGAVVSVVALAFVNRRFV